MRNVIVIDDEQPILDMVVTMLAEGGFSATGFTSSEKALNWLGAQQDISLVITDIVMPEKEGIETIIEIKRNNPDMRIMAMSGGGQVAPTEYLRMAKMLGAKVTITKPFSRKEFMDAVIEAMA